MYLATCHERPSGECNPANVSGRGFGHYFIALFPSVVLLGGLALDGALSEINTVIAKNDSHMKAHFLKDFTILLVLYGFVMPLIRTVRANYPRSFKENTAEYFLSAYISESSDVADRIFVWGVQPEIYIRSKRKSATRYTVCNWLTGMIFWTNGDPDMNTDYAIVPGAREIFLEELKTNKPKFIVDTSPSNWQGYGKYPLAYFKELDEFINKYYVLDPDYPANDSTTATKLYKSK